MRPRRRRTFLPGSRCATACALAVAAAVAVAVAAAARSRTPEPIHGITLSTHTNGSDWASATIGETLADMQALGATWVAIHPYAGIRADGTVRFRSLQGRALPEYLARPIREARRRGMRILIKPHLAYWGSPFAWRGDIRFDRIENWERFWTTYTAWVVDLAKACSGADGFVVGTELDQTLHDEAAWRAVIAAVRAATPAPLTYAANWTHYREVPFWDALDVVGIQAYFPLSDSLTTDATVIQHGWQRWMRELEAFAVETGKDIVFTELGYSRTWTAPVKPWEHHVDGPEAEALQATCLRVALESIEAAPHVRGAFLWKWFPNPYPVGRDFQLATPRIKATIRRIWLHDG